MTTLSNGENQLKHSTGRALGKLLEEGLFWPIKETQRRNFSPFLLANQ